MGHLIQRILKVAANLYTSSNSSNFSEIAVKSNYNLLISLMSNLKASDVNYDQEEIDKRILVRAPCAYISLFENQDLNLSIFSIGPHSRLPLHNHPNMYGFLKVLSGKIVIKNYDLIQSDLAKPPINILNQVPIERRSHLIVPTIELESKIISFEDENLALIEPTKGNIHEITVASDCSTGSAFIDLITPPYDANIPDRSASYYQVIGQSYSDKLSKNITWLLAVPTPDDYWCQHVRYTGPELSEQILKEK